jgi:hypothetical protein
MPRILSILFLSLSFAQGQTLSTEPEFLRVLHCGDLDHIVHDSISVAPFWYVDKAIAVPPDRSEYVMHRSGKIIRLCAGEYTLSSLRAIMREGPRCNTYSEVKIPCPPTPVYHLPVLLPHKKYLVHEADTVDVQLSKVAEVEVIVADIFGDEIVSFSFKGDLVPVPVRLGGYKQASAVSINTNRTFDDIVLQRAPERKIARMNQLLEELERQTSGSPSFRQLSRAYLLGVNGYDLEALMILRDLEKSEKDPLLMQAGESFRALLEVK